MVLNSTTTHFDFSGYRILEQLYAGSRTEVYRAVRDGDSASPGGSEQSVVIKLLRQQHPTLAELVQFRNQYAIAKNLNNPGIVKPYSLEPFHNGYALVMEDFGGISLRQFAQGAALSLDLFLPIALQIIDILHPLHQQRIIHKDIKPANILIHPVTRQIKLIDFSIASLLPRETQEIQSPGGLEGTLAYLSPEQTGRMNRGIDYRSDFYSLGVTFFELLTGQLPFQSHDAMELVHCHIAKLPPSVCDLNPILPRMLGEVIRKLMAKNAEDRYQGAIGLKHDLLCCQELSQELSQEPDQELNQEQGQTTVQPIEFELGQNDISDRFLIPEKLYGRQAEVETLLQAFNRVSSGGTELLLVAGFSGIGKTAVVNEVHKPIARWNGYFIKGKFDQFNRNIPLSAFVQALRDLMGQLLSETDAQLAQWQAKILAAVGENGQVLIEVIPELEQIIGKQPPALELSGVTARNRFNLLFQKFIEVFTTAEHPLVLFLDDLQWADSASLQLVKLLMNDSGYLLVLGAYRDNEVSPVHPFILTVEDLKQAQAIVHTITLSPLAFDDTNHLVADTLKCSRELAQPLTELIDRKTQGNPFFTTQFLKALHEDQQIRFDYNRRYWECDIAQVNALSLTDDVVEFMAVQLQKLPTATQQVLKLAACIGNQFDLATLAIISGQSFTETASNLWKALQEGLILPISETYKFFQSTDAEVAVDRVAVPYKFLHDRVQQAAYSLIDQAQKQATHLYIGTLLLENLSANEREERLFEIVNHLNVGRTSIVQPAKREELAQLNFLAGCKAKATTAYAAALSYIEVAIDLLPDNCFESHYQLSFNLFKGRAEAEYLNGNLKAAEIWIDRALAKAKTALEKADVFNMAIVQYTLQAKYAEAIQVGHQALALMGIDLPAENLEAALESELSISTNILKDSSFALLSKLPIMTQREQKMAIKLLISMGPPTYRSHQRLWSVICAKAVNLCLQFGNTPEIGYIYPAFGGLRGYALNNYQGTDQLLEITLKLIQAFNDKSAESVAYLVIGSSLRHWSHPLKAATEDYLSSYRVGLESSNLQYAAYAFGHNMYCRFYQSVPLDQLFEEVIESLNFSQKYKNQWAIDLMFGGQTVISELIGTQEKQRFFERATYHSETEYLEQCKAHKNWQVICIFNILKTQVLFCFDQLDQALEYGRQADAEIINVAPQGLLPYPHHLFIYALLLASLYPNATASQQLDYWEKIETYQNQLEVWAQSCPANFLHLCCLVKAEVARISKNYLEAIELYDRAIALARAHQYLQEEALANELAARFYLEWNKPRLAQEYMIEAYYGYVRWGAKAKVADLESRYPQLLAPILQQTRSAFSVNDTTFTLDTTSSHTALFCSLSNSLFDSSSSSSSSSQLSSNSSSPSSSSISDTLDLDTILKVSQTLSSEIELEKLLSTLLKVAIENAGADQGVLMLRQEGLIGDIPIGDLPTCDTEAESLWIEGVASTESPPIVLQHIPVSTSQNIPHKLIYTVKRRLQAVVLADATTHSEFANDPYILRQQPKSVLCNPILNRGQFVGILYLENNLTKAAFSRDRVELLNLLCTQAAISIENARLYEKAQSYAQSLERSLKGQELLFEVVCDIRRSLDVNTISTVVTQRVRQVLAADRVIIHQFDLASAYNTGEIVAEAVLPEFPTALHAKVEDHCFGERYAEYYQQGRVYALPDLDQAEVAPCYRQVLQQFAIKADLAAPILWRGELWGLLCVHQCSQPRHWSTEEIQFTKQMAAQLGVALEQAKLLNQTREQSTQLEQTLQHLQQTQVQLVQNEKMSALGNLVAGVAHEINNPIGFIAGNIEPARDYVQDLLGLVDLYQETYPNPAAAIDDEIAAIDLEYVRQDLPKLIDSMKLGVDRIRDISTSLRTFSRADKDYKVPFNIHEGIDSTILILKHRLKANDDRPAIEIVTHYGNLPPVECFPGQLNQVFMNILANAIDALEESNQGRSFDQIKANPNCITITTELHQQQAAIRISDNGVGMSEDIKQQIFDHLFTTKAVGQGTGLGLAIVQQIVVEQHRGSIAVESAIGQGTTFVISLPT